MNPRFVLDESSWASAPANAEIIESSLFRLLERCDAARTRGEGIARHEAFYSTHLAGTPIFSVLFESDANFKLQHDLEQRLAIVLDRADPFDEDGFSTLDAKWLSRERLSPGVVAAHAGACAHRAIAVLPLPHDQPECGPLDVTVGTITHRLHFVTSEAEHLVFFRDVFDVEDVGAAAFKEIAPSAFPSLEWVDGVWHELRVNQKYFFAERRPTLVSHLAVLNDNGAEIFHSCPGGDGVAERLAVLEVEASSENGNARKHNASIKERTRAYAGASEVFWWHTKINWKDGRVHFLHVPKKPASDRPACGHIVIGIFAKHCVLPGHR